MSWSLIDEATPVTATTGSSMALTFPSTPNVGDTLIIGYTVPSAGTVSPSSISQAGVTWVRGDAHVTSTQICHLWVGTVTSAPGTVATVNLSGSIVGGQTARVWGTRFTCTGTVSVGVAGVGSSGTAATRNSETLSPTASKSALIYAFQRGGGTFTSGPTNSFTALTSGATNTTPAYLIVSSTTGTYSTSWTYSTSAAFDTTAIVLYETPAAGVKFKPWFAH